MSFPTTHTTIIKFGTDGIRGVAGQPPLVPDILKKIAAAATRVIKTKKTNPKILIARDTRQSGEIIEKALCEGFCSAGCQVYLAGILPTPAASVVTAKAGFDACVVITASHNPWQDNGVKFFNSDGYKWDDQQEREIENLLTSELDAPEIATCHAVKFETGAQIYREHILDKLGQNADFTDFKIVLDCANGASYQTAPQILKSLRAQVIPIAVQPDGKNINQNCGSLHPEKLRSHVLANNADLGIALDGDADRILLVDNTGAELDGDDILAILTAYMHEKNTLLKNIVVATVMSNYGLEEFLTARGIKMIRTPVGDKHVIEAMRSGGYSLGGEQSGHIVIGGGTPTGDGLLAALHVMKILKEKQQTLADLRQILKKFPQKLYNIAVLSKPPIETLPLVSCALADLEEKIRGQGRVLLRYSGTENKIRLMVEARPGTDIDQLAAPLLNALSQEIATKLTN
jgi:phosphoglucosamine mutase